MEIDKHLLKYCLYFAVTVLLIYMGISIFDNISVIFYFISSILGTIINLIKPLLIALVIAYLLKSGVYSIENFLKNKKLLKKASSRRSIGILVMYTLVISVFTAIISGIYLMVGGKLSNNTSISNMTLYLTDYLNNSSLSVEYISKQLENLNISFLGNLNDKIAQIVSYIQGFFAQSITSLANLIVSMGSNLTTFFIAFILSIYLIKDSEYFLDLWEKFFTVIFGKSKIGGKIKEVFSIIDHTFSRYIRGQLLEACIVGVLSTIVLFFIGIDYALIIGIIAGVCNMIPYIGPLVGTVLAVIMALLSGQPISAIWATVGMLVVQQVDNNFLAPKIVGNSVGLHPVFTMIAIIIGGNIGGLIGMLTAVPFAASLKILISKWYDYHIQKSSKV